MGMYVCMSACLMCFMCYILHAVACCLHVLLNGDDLQAALVFAVYLVVHALAGPHYNHCRLWGGVSSASFTLDAHTGLLPYDAC